MNHVADQFGHERSRLQAQSAAKTDDTFGSFNDDLVWILDKLVERTGGAFGVILGRVAPGPDISILAQSSDSPDLSPLLLRTLAASLPSPADVVSPVSHEARVTVTQLQTRDSGYAGSARVLELCLTPAPGVAIVASVIRSDGLDLFSAVHRATANRLYPVLSRYLRLWWLHRAERRRADSLSSALDLADVAVMLFDRGGKLVFANPAADHLLERSDGLRLADSSVVADASSERLLFDAHLKNAIDHNLSRRASGSHVRMLALKRRLSPRPLIITMTSLRRAAVDATDAAVAVYALDPDQDVGSILEPVCAVYALTPAETRLVSYLIRGARLAEAASGMRIKLETARAYLKEIFSKTGTHRQAELMRLMLSSAMRLNYLSTSVTPLAPPIA